MYLMQSSDIYPSSKIILLNILNGLRKPNIVSTLNAMLEKSLIATLKANNISTPKALSVCIWQKSRAGE